VFSPFLLLTVRREGVTCEDSCQSAFNGVCEDGSEGELDQYYEQYGYYQSDDLGGYGGSDGTEGERDPAGGSYAEVRMHTHRRSDNLDHLKFLTNFSHNYRDTARNTVTTTRAMMASKFQDAIREPTAPTAEALTNWWTTPR
jgi:hypothetical protein